ncbi:type 1 fimbrial major subunit FimA [Citrobacter freundii]|nr:type-1 fimbrial protein subunit A [Citrobacter freundii]KLV81743.1 type-1 fimbrial protein, A chain [Citrobacter sp. MGH109]KLV82462.1 type-1 fimbrial protein, A chain [Citrobacter sp. BIDMC107]SBV62213.1 putative fimbrial-like adhesin protein [uncultured Citrobacter sp.]GAL39008.1 type 1 fimbriae major subunit FimA [Citrobacter freundii ATCC 8090 = MTCC 1658 = NBRC 12681]
MCVIQGKSMKRKLMTSSVIASLMLVAGAAVAADPVSVSGGTVHFEGELVNAACAVSTQSSDQVVTLGQYRTASFAAVGDTTAQIPFSIVLNDCDPKVAATAAVAFSGQSDITNNNLLAVTSADNGTTASGVGIEILDNTSTALKPDGATFSTAQALVEGTNTLRFSARYKATATSATPGQANADATFIMKYE